MIRLGSKLLLLLPLISLAGCASNIPREIQDPPPDNPTISEVRHNIEQYEGARVRWGGTIASVENKAEETWIEVVAHELGSYGQPEDDDSSYGRFLVRIPAFLDPQIYAEGRELTVAGEVESRIVRKIGEHPYTYPLIRASNYYLWPQNYARRDRGYYHHHYYYGYPWGYRYHFGFGHHFRHHPHFYYW